MTINDFFNYGILGKMALQSADGSLNMPLVIIGAVICAIIPYLLGSINFAIIISKSKYKTDIRNFGSGNAGATNMLRTFGKAAAGLTFLGDALKAFVSGIIGYAVLGQYGVYIAGLFCILGHMFPLYYKFKGGKGVVTAAISILMCNPFVFLILFVLFVIIVACTKYVSLGSIMCVLLYPVILDRIEKWINGATGAYVVIAIVISLLVVIMHRENIVRLMNGTESKLSFKSKNNDNAKSEKKENE